VSRARDRFLRLFWSIFL